MLSAGVRAAGQNRAVARMGVNVLLEVDVLVDGVVVVIIDRHG